MGKDEIDIMDTNLAGIGSDADIAARVEAAKTEAAWADAGKEPGLQIWRIEKFQVVKSATPKGHFYSNDSYICLNTYKAKDEEGKETDKLAWDIHFWLGKTSTMDEMGTAAYKTVELDDLLGGSPVQHREVEGHESKLFVSYFKDGIRILDGGIESGFNSVKPTEYKPRLLHIKGKKRVRVEEKKIEHASLNQGDVFILDAGLRILQWQGKKAGIFEKQKGATLSRAIDDERAGKPEVVVIEGGEKSKEEEEFFSYFGGYPEEELPEEDGCDMSWESNSTKALYKLSDEEGKLQMTKIDEISREAFTSDDVFIYDIGCEVFAWVGKGASDGERRGAMANASNYLQENNRPNWLPVSIIFEGGENEVFKASF